jgi:hypothetical protein
MAKEIPGDTLSLFQSTYTQYGIKTFLNSPNGWHWNNQPCFTSQSCYLLTTENPPTGYGKIVLGTPTARGYAVADRFSVH